MQARSTTASADERDATTASSHAIPVLLNSAGVGDRAAAHESPASRASPRAARPTRSRRSRRPPRAAPTRATRPPPSPGRASASSVSRASGSWEPMATTVAWSATSDAVEQRLARGRGAADDVGGGDQLVRRRSASRPTMSTCSIGRTARIASTWPWACGPRPKTSRRRASGAASARTASAETAGVRTLVSAMPSTSATGASVVASKTTQTPWMRGSPPTVTSLTTAWAAVGRRHHEQLAARRARARCAAGRPRGPGRPAARPRARRSRPSGRGAARRRAAARKGRLIAGRSRCPAGRAGRGRSGARRCGRPSPRPR